MNNNRQPIAMIANKQRSPLHQHRGWVRIVAFLLLLTVLVPLFCLPKLADATSSLLQSSEQESVQTFLDDQPGVLKQHRDNGQLASSIIEHYSRYYGLNPALHLVLLETTNQLLSNPNPAHAMLLHPYSTQGPPGFKAQIEWASRELRAAFGPYEQAPILSFSDGTTTTLALNQEPEILAAQRFLAQGRTQQEWHTLIKRFDQVFADYFNKTFPQQEVVTPWGETLETPTDGFLQCPWPIGMRVVHLAYFDHAYPTVDIGGDGNNVVATYVGAANVQYNTHDGHDYFFPDLPVGTPILAAASGMAYASTVRGNGVYIVHPDGYETVYWHLNYFAPQFRDIVDTYEGIWVNAGDMLGTSGTSGFSYGTPHLHFEVRHHGRQVDPYGWYGPGEDPCDMYAGCVNEGWLWHESLYGLYDFTPPDYDAPNTAGENVALDRTPPIATMSINPPDDLLFLARFDGHILQQVGSAYPATKGTVSFDTGRYGRSLYLPDGSGIAYPTLDNLNLESGTIALWAKIPEFYPPSGIDRHYLFAASANPDEEKDYLGTMALRRDLLGSNSSPRWDFWTTPMSNTTQRNDLAVPDTLEPGWHHFAVSWNQSARTKTLFIDGMRVAFAENVVLPTDVGEELQLGRFTYGGSQSGMRLDDLAIFGRELNDHEILEIANSQTPISDSSVVLDGPELLIDTNALDEDGVIVAVQIGQNGVFQDPQPYYDSFRWRLPPVEGMHTLAVRYFDRASNQRTITHTLMLNMAPRGYISVVENNSIAATLAITATDLHMPVDMQISQSSDFEYAQWEPMRPNARWIWIPETSYRATGSKRELYVRFRDSQGQISDPIHAWFPANKLFIPQVIK